MPPPKDNAFKSKSFEQVMNEFLKRTLHLFGWNDKTCEKRQNALQPHQLFSLILTSIEKNVYLKLVFFCLGVGLFFWKCRRLDALTNITNGDFRKYDTIITDYYNRDYFSNTKKVD